MSTRDDADRDSQRDEDQPSNWLKLHRRLVDSRVFASPPLLQLWIWCLCRANYKKRFVTVRTGSGDTVVEVQPGQFIYGRESAAKELRMKAGTVRNRMRKLETMGNIAMQPATHFTLVTVCKWDTYQSRSEDDGQPEGQPQDSQRTTTGQPEDTDKKDKKDKKEKKSGGAAQKDVGEGLISAIPPELDTPEFHEAWANLLDYRRNFKKNGGLTISPAWMKAFFRKWAPLGAEQTVSAINNSMANGWHGVHEKKADETQSPRKARPLTESELNEWRPS